MLPIPTNCPSCGSTLSRTNDQLFCLNADCDAKTAKIVSHFAKTIKIKGLGEKTIEKLELTSVPEIYELSKDYVSSIIGDKLADKLLAEIETSKSSSLEEVLPALSIRLVGTSAASKLCAVVSHISEINRDTCAKAGLGDAVTNSLLTWLEANLGWLLELPLSFKSSMSSKSSNGPTQQLGTVCITGKLLKFKNRELAAAHLKSLGYNVTDSVSKNTHFLVDEEGKKSSKRDKAVSLNIPIVSIQELEERSKL